MTKYQKRKNNAVVNKKFSNSRQNKRKFAKPNTQVIPHVNQALNGSNKALKLVEKGESAVTYANGAKHTNDKPTGNTSDAYDEMKAQLESGEQTNSKLLTMLQATKDILPRRISFKKASKVDSYDLLKNKLVPLGFLQDTTNKQEKTSKKSNLKTLYTSVTESRQNDSATSPAMEDYPIKPKFFLFPPEKILSFMGWKEVNKIGPGLYNLGNTCFMNAVLQCLTYTAPLVNYLKSRDVTAKNSKTFNILDQMTLHVKKSLETSQAFSPKEFAHNLRSIGKRFRFGRQEDSHELIICMLDGMQNIMLQSYKGKLDPRTAETNPIHQIFGGYLQSQVKSLESKYVSNTYDAFVDLNLGINNSSSVDKALKLFIKPDILDGDNKLKCPMCKKYVTAKKQFTIFQAPNILMVNLKRFDIFGRKINKHVQFDEKLSLKEYMSENAIGRNESEYTLYAVLVHDGSSANSGHYYAFVKASNSIWYLMDDSSVQQVSVQTVLKQKAYILFYMKDKPLQLFKTPLPSAQKADKAPNGHTHNQVDSEDEDESETTAKDKKGEKKSSANLNSSESDDDEDLVADSQESNDSDDVGKVVSEKSLRNGLKVKSSSTSRTNGSVKAQKQQLKQQNSNGDTKDKASLKSPKTNSKQATPGPILLANNKDNKQQDKKQTKAPQLKANKTASSKEIHQGRNPQEELESLFDKVKTQKIENGTKGEETSLLKSISTKIGGKPKTPTDQSDPASDSAKLPSPTTPTTSKAQHASTVPSTQNSTEFDPRLLASDHKSQFGTTVGTWEETGEDTKQMRDSLLKQLTPKQNKKRKRDQWDAEYDKGKTKKIKMKKPSIKQQQSIPTSPTGGSRANPFQNVANRKKPQ